MRLRDFLEMDFSLFFAALILSVFGILFIYSSGVTSAGVLVSTEYMRQIVWAIGGMILALALALINYRRFYDLSLYLYLGTIILLIYTCLFGRLVNGARAWIGIGSFGIQPSEFSKITTILFLARYLDSSKKSRNTFVRFACSCIIVFLPMAIILLQPDFGTSLVFIPILLVMTFIAGLSIRYVAFLGICIMLASLFMALPLWQSYILGNNSSFFMILTNIRFAAITMLVLALIMVIALLGYIWYKKRYFYWIVYTAAIIIFSLGASFAAQKVLKDYQIMRLIVFLDPNVDPRGSGWNIIQSITAIGSGGLLGKGYLHGTQSHYRFLPQQSTDFIFTMLPDEWGLLGGVLVFILFLLICLRLVKIMKSTADPFGCYIAAGLSSMYIFHFLVNVGMTMGIMPITGIPLLFMSYGGSALTSAMAGIGFALSIYIRRFRH
ncbi:MAG: rod shape-determining protein RodA [Treponema sp.]|jgi:rod shape determining protein RodA|nr:rod shape-determining protein RodA [Treponema sp.]